MTLAEGLANNKMMRGPENIMVPPDTLRSVFAMVERTRAFLKNPPAAVLALYAGDSMQTVSLTTKHTLVTSMCL
jgi:hypothetical protein